MLRRAMVEAADATALTIVHPPMVERSETALTGFVLLAESHISIHYYPSQRCMKIDVFSCSEQSPLKGLERLAAIFRARVTNIRLIDRTKTFTIDPFRHAHEHEHEHEHEYDHHQYKTSEPEVLG